MPIIARWRMPPENSCGYWCARRSGSGMRTARSRSTARASAALRPMPWWWRATSASWPPIRRVGLNEVIGSWNTIASEVPSSCRCACVSAAAQVGAEQLQARRRRRGRGRSTSRETASAVSDLPEPDSPTTPTASPRRTAKDTPRTGRIGPSGPGKVTRGRGRRAPGRSPRCRAGRRRPASRHRRSSCVACLVGSAAGCRRPRRRRAPWRPTRRTG